MKIMHWEKENNHRILFVLIFTIFLISGKVHAGGMPANDTLFTAVKKPYATLGVVFQAQADFIPDRWDGSQNGFRMQNLYGKIKGSFHDGFYYLLQVRFQKSPNVLDGYLGYRIARSHRIQIGLFKTPSSYEYLTPAHMIDLVERARFIVLLDTKRQMGLQWIWTPMQIPIEWGFSITNGNGIQLSGDNDGRMLVNARLTGDLRNDDKSWPGRWKMGIAVSYAEDSRTPVGSGVLGSFSGRRYQYGMEFQWRYRRWQIKGESRFTVLDWEDGSVYRPEGFYLTVLYRLHPFVELLVRDDYLDQDHLELIDAGNHWWIAGMNVQLSSYVRIQTNYIIDTKYSQWKHHRLLMKFQLAI